MRICVYGAASNDIDRIYIDKTVSLGEKIAERGHTLVFGAGANGCMGAAARGAFAQGGKIIGIAPTFFNADGIIYDGCTEFIGTKTMRERKQLLEDNADAFVVVPGGIGTMDEFFEILTLKQLSRHKKAIAFFNVNGYYDELQIMLDKMVEKGFVGEKIGELYSFFTDESDLLDYLEGYSEKEVDVTALKRISKEPQK